MYPTLTIFFAVFLSTAAVSTTIAAANKPSTCPDGSQPVQCFVNPCVGATCSGHPNAVCRPNYCGGCNAEFFNPLGRQVTCGTSKPTKKPVTTAAPSTCPDGSTPVQCFLDPCRYATCPAFPNAVCHANYCGGCNAEFFNPSGHQVACGTSKPTKKPVTTASPSTCSDGTTPVQCLIDPCRTATCSAFPNAVCRANYCGGCNAEFFNSAGRKVTCSAAMTTAAPGTCADGSRPVQCFVDPCRSATCPAFPNAVCRANYCGGCNADFYNGGVKVDCVRGMPASCPVLRCMACPAGQSYTKDAKGCDTCACGTNAVTTTSKPQSTPKPLCGPVCDIYCPNGNVLDNNGCPTCRCKPTTQTTPKPVCGPVCDIYCPSGNVLDASGCATCRCKPSPTATSGLPSTRPTIRLPTIRPTKTVCGPVCALFCPNGHVLDANGCPTCRCKPDSS